MTKHEMSVVYIVWTGVRAETKACRVLVGKPEGKKPLGRTRLRRKDIVIMVSKKNSMAEDGLGSCGSG
jgi:hypothetical protein